MDRNPQLASASRVVRIIHAALLGGLIACGAMLYLVRRVSPPPAVGDSGALALVFAVAAIVVLAGAVGALRPRVPERTLQQDSDAFWNDAGSRVAAIVLWAMIEGAGLVGAVGFFLTGAPAPAGAFALAVAALALLQPGRLEGDGAT